MQTNFTPEQLRDPATARSNRILRTCVHCGFCTATCPTYQVLGDELDSPRGRIYLIKDMLEAGRPADAKTVKHIDRCLSCLACMTTCPSGVHYMHLVDHARAYIEETYRRPPLGAGAALDAGEDPALSAALPLRAPGRAARAAVRAADAGAAPGDAGARAEGPAARSPAPRPAGVSGRGAAAPAGGAAGRLRAARPRPADQRRHDPPPHPARLRGGAGGGGRLLRGADPPHGQDAREPRLGGEERPGLDARSSGRGARRDRDQHQRLRHDGQGLRPHVPRARPWRRTRRGSRGWPATSPS